MLIRHKPIVRLKLRIDMRRRNSLVPTFIDMFRRVALEAVLDRGVGPQVRSPTGRDGRILPVLVVGRFLRRLLDVLAILALGGLLGRVAFVPAYVHRGREVGAEFFGEIAVAATAVAFVLIVVVIGVTRGLARRAFGLFAAELESKVFDFV